jgi:hypothetical protein
MGGRIVVKELSANGVAGKPRVAAKKRMKA